MQILWPRWVDPNATAPSLFLHPLSLPLPRPTCKDTEKPLPLPSLSLLLTPSLGRGQAAQHLSGGVEWLPHAQTP